MINKNNDIEMCNEDIDWSYFGVQKEHNTKYNKSKEMYIKIIKSLKLFNGNLISNYCRTSTRIDFEIDGITLNRNARFITNLPIIVENFKKELSMNNDSFIRLVFYPNNSKTFAEIHTFDGGNVTIAIHAYKSFVEWRKNFYKVISENGHTVSSSYEDYKGFIFTYK